MTRKPKFSEQVIREMGYSRRRGSLLPAFLRGCGDGFKVGVIILMMRLMIAIYTGR
jgi:hypothetical protein